MLLSARMLNNVMSVNVFDYVNQVQLTQGDQFTVSFQLIDLTMDTPDKGFSPAGRRYIPAAGASLTVLFDTLDDAKKITRACSQPYTQDPSIWQVTLMATDTIKGSGNLRLTLNEGTVTRRGSVSMAFTIFSQNSL
ncbi:MAG: hypothetical protein NVS9B9_19700 [Ktedonobacteraceae bacterium]